MPTLTGFIAINNGLDGAFCNGSIPKDEAKCRKDQQIREREGYSQWHPSSENKSMVTFKANHGKRVQLGLVRGQRWQAKGEYLDIVDRGKRLVHYRLIRGTHRGISRTQTSDVASVEAYIRNHRASLVTKGSVRGKVNSVQS